MFRIPHVNEGIEVDSELLSLFWDLHMGHEKIQERNTTENQLGRTL